MAETHLPMHLLRTGTLPRGRLGRADGAAGVRLTEVAGFAAAMIVARKGQRQATAEKLAEAFGVAVEDGPRRVAKGATSITGLAPGQWLAVQREADDWEFTEKLVGVLSGTASVTPQGNGRMIVEVSGEQVRATLAKGVPVDLHPASFPVGSAAQTTASHIGLGVSLLDSAPTFELISAASTRASLLTWLVSSAAEYGLEVG
jgi:methylglutamate dehydrogenase subunit D